jgi:protein SCO1/2
MPVVAAVFLLLLALSAPVAVAQDDNAERFIFDPQAAIARSQATIGGRLSDHLFIDQDGRDVRLSDYGGKPLVVSLVFTACAEACPVLIEYLAEAVEVAREALGADGFAVVTVGFDAERETLDALIEELGFMRVESPRGFDHLAQTSILDGERRIFRHVYGADFEAPALVDPLKALLFDDVGRLADLSDLIERVRLFCTFYDAKKGRYAFDYSFFISLAIGSMALLCLAIVLIRAWLRSGKFPGNPA